MDETEDYAGLEDVEPEFSQQDAPVQRDGADDDGEYPAFASNLTYNFSGASAGNFGNPPRLTR